MRIRLRAPHSKGQWILLLLGLGVTAACVIPLARGVMSLTWPTTDGVITHSRDKVVHRRIDVDIGYSYSVAGRTYSADRYRFRYPLLVIYSRDANVVIGRYQPGEPVKVAVNPADPTDAVLEAGPDFETLIPLCLGLLLLLLSIGDVRSDANTAAVPAVLPRPVAPRYRTAKILAVIGVALFLFGAWHLYRGLASTTWPATQGKILYSHVQSGHYETLLWYEYYVDNRRYLASNYRNGGNATPFRSVAEEAAKRYPAGRTVAVYYDPGNPNNALLEPGLWYGNFVAPAISLIVLFAAWVAKRLAEAMAASRSRRIARG